MFLCIGTYPYEGRKIWHQERHKGSDDGDEGRVENLSPHPPERFFGVSQRIRGYSECCQSDEIGGVPGRQLFHVNHLRKLIFLIKCVLILKNLLGSYL